MVRPAHRPLQFQALESRTMLTTYFVAANGNDHRDGTTIARAWGTLQHAVETIHPGDTIKVENGTYRGFQISNSGTIYKPMTITADTGAHVVINSPGLKNKLGSLVEVNNPNVTVGYWIIHGLEVAGSRVRSGIDVRNATNIILDGNYVHDNRGWGIYESNVDNSTITRNHVANSFGQSGIFLIGSGDNNTITYNEVDHSHASGISLSADLAQGGKGYTTGDLIAQNKIHDNVGVGVPPLAVAVGAGLDLDTVDIDTPNENNPNLTLGGAGLSLDGVVNSQVQNNLLYNNHSTGIVLYKNQAGSGSHDDLIINNTVIMPSDARWAVNITLQSPNNSFYNNILVEGRPNLGVLEIDASSLVGFTADYNIYGGNVNISTTGGRSRETLARWQSTSLQDQNSFIANVDTIFASFGADDFRLKKGSVAIDAGTADTIYQIVTTTTTINGITTTTNTRVAVDLAPSIDLLGAPRPKGKGYDIGAYEWQPVK